MATPALHPVGSQNGSRRALALAVAELALLVALGYLLGSACHQAQIDFQQGRPADYPWAVLFGFLSKALPVVVYVVGGLRAIQGLRSL